MGKLRKGKCIGGKYSIVISRLKKIPDFKWIEIFALPELVLLIYRLTKSAIIEFETKK